MNAKTIEADICLVVGENNAALCIISLAVSKHFSFSSSVDGCIACVCRNHELISACKASLLVVPTGSKDSVSVRIAYRCLVLFKYHSTLGAAAAHHSISLTVLLGPGDFF
jgi:hypothetical protein